MDHIHGHKLHGLEHLSLPVAAAQTYYQVVARTPEKKNVSELDRILNDVARALTNVALIYVPDGIGVRPLSAVELLESRFSRGATALVLKDGTELRGLTIRRVDMRAAIAVLKAVNARFE